MNKKIIYLTLISSAFSFSEVHGQIKLSSESKVSFNRETILGNHLKEAISHLPFSPKIELEVNDSYTGIDFGLEYTAKNLSPQREFLKDFNPIGNIWLKYNLPEIYSTKSYIKATLEDEIKLKSFPYLNNTVRGEIELNLDHSYMEYVLGFNTKTKVKLHDLNFPMFNRPGYRKIKTLTTLNDVESTHTLSIKRENLYKLKDFKAEISANHTWNNFKNISFSTEAKYKEIENLEIKGAASIKYNHEHNSVLFKDNNNIEKKAGDYKSLVIKLEMNSIYNSKYDDFNANIFINNFKILTPKKMNTSFINDGFITYGIKLDNTIKPINGLSILTKVSLDARTNISRIADPKTIYLDTLEINRFNGKPIKKSKTIFENEKKTYSTKGYFETELGLKYDYKPIDIITISPAISAKINISDISYNKVKKKYTYKNTFSVTPEIGAEYEIIKNLKLRGLAKTEFIFGKSTDRNGNFSKTEFQKVDFNGNIGIKYSW